MLAPASSTPRILSDRLNLQDRQERFQAVDTPEAYGSVVGDALARFGDKAHEVAIQFAQRDAERDAQEGDVEFQRRSREIMLGRQADPNIPGDTGRVGYLTMEGQDAQAHRTQTEADLAAARADILSRRKTTAAATAFGNVSANRLESTLRDADTHLLQQTRVSEDATREALAQENRNTAVTHYMNEAEAAANIDAGVEVVLQQADADGASMPRTEAMVRSYTSSAWAEVITRRADDDPDGAQHLFDARRGTMNAEDVARVEGAIHSVVLASRAQANTDRLLVAHGNDYTAALAEADNIPNIAERDETRARILRMGTERETAEARSTDDAEERARTAITAHGFSAVTGADRYLLQREGRWNALVSEFNSAANGAGGGEATRRRAQNMADTLLLMADENPQQFHIVVDAMRGMRTPGVTDEMVAAASGGLTRADLVGMRNNIVGVNAGAMRDIVRRQSELRGQAPVGGSNDTIVTRLAGRLMEQGEPLAAARGMDVRRASLAQTLTGQGNRQNTRNAEWQGFMMQEARRFVQENGGRDPTQAEMDAIIRRGITRGGTGMAFEARHANPGAWFGDGQNRVVVPFSEIDEAGQRELHQAYRRTHHLELLPMTAIPEGVKRRYAAIWRDNNPGVTVAPGSAQERELEQFIQQGWTDDPSRTSALRDRREWMERAYANDLQRY